MNKDTVFVSLMIFSRALVTRASFLRLHEYVPLDLSQRGWQQLVPCLKRAVPRQDLSPVTLPWMLYPKWALYKYVPSWEDISIKQPVCLHVNLGKLQPHFTILQAGHRPLKTYSFGYLLRLYLVQTKRTRRDLKRLTLAVAFFKKYFRFLFKRRHSTLVLDGYQRRYNLFIYQSLIGFAQARMTQLVFLPKTLKGFFLFRRVKGVKKRIRKRLKKLTKLM